MTNRAYSSRLKKEILKGFLHEEIGSKYTLKMFIKEFLKDECKAGCDARKLLESSKRVITNIQDTSWWQGKFTDGSVPARAAGDGLDALLVSVGGSSSMIVNSAFFMSQSANIWARNRASSVAAQQPMRIWISGFVGDGKNH